MMSSWLRALGMAVAAALALWVGFPSWYPSIAVVAFVVFVAGAWLDLGVRLVRRSRQGD